MGSFQDIVRSQPTVAAFAELDAAEMRCIEGGQMTVADVVKANETANDGSGLAHALYYLMFLKS